MKIEEIIESETNRPSMPIYTEVKKHLGTTRSLNCHRTHARICRFFKTRPPYPTPSEFAVTALNVHPHYAAARYEAIGLRRWVGRSGAVIGDAYRMSGLMRRRVQGIGLRILLLVSGPWGLSRQTHVLSPCDIDMAVVFGRELWGDCEWLIMLQHGLRMDYGVRYGTRGRLRRSEKTR